MRRGIRLPNRRAPTFPMAKRTKNLVGLDIDATGIVATSVAVNGRLRVERVAATSLEPGIIRDGEVTDVDGLADALRKLYRGNKGLSKHVRVGLANQKIVVRIIDLPYLEDAKELEAAVRREMVERVLAALRAAGLKPAGIDLSAFAMVRALHRAGPEDEHVLYLAVGGLTNLAVARGTACTFARASGGGVEALAIELAERSQLTLEHAHGWLT